MASSSKTVLVLGAYGFVGAEIVKGIIEKTSLSVIATGRNSEKLNTAHPETGERLSLSVLDAGHAGQLKEICTKADLVINCVGPYAISGADIAKTVIESGKSYIDFANEQIHYNRVAALDGMARKKGVFLMTAAGLVPGFSTLLMLIAAKEIDEIKSLETFYAERRRINPEAGIASILSGILETGYESKMLRNSSMVPFKMGSLHCYEQMPKPIGRIYVLAVPGADTLIIPPIIQVQNMQNWFGMQKPFFGAFELIGLLKPHKNPAMYSVVKKIVTFLLKHEHNRAVAKGIGPDMVLTVKAKNEIEGLEYQLWTPDGGKGTAYFPIILSKMWEDGRLSFQGFATPALLKEPEKIFDEMNSMGLRFELKKITYDIDTSSISR